MDFRTKIPVSASHFQLSHKDRIMVIGSCFAENIGNRLNESGFISVTNPFGVLYNPSSISSAIRRLIRSERINSEELIEYDGLFHSFSHHGSFSGMDPVATLDSMNHEFDKAVEALKRTTCLIITFGTSWVYALAENGQVVANCHKLPSAVFNRYRLSVDSIFKDYSSLFSEMLKINEDLKIIMTVSPIRHFRDGAHENNVSKSVLLLAEDDICAKFSQALYYPSYEIMLDELRDYRFYNEDMVHPSQVAQDYIWEHFSNTFFSKSTREVTRQVQQIRKAMNHRPLHEGSEMFSRFARKNLASIELLLLSEPELDLSEEKRYFENIIDGFDKI